MSSMRRKSPLVIPSILAVVVLVALGFVMLRNQAPAPAPQPSDSATASPSPTTSPDPDNIAGETRTVRVITDGWTVRTLKGIPVYVTDSLQETVPVAFIPLQGEELAQVRAQAPEALVGSLARMLPQDDRVSCTADACSWAGQDVPDDWFTNPANVPSLGPSYAGWGVESLLYTATVTVDVSMGPVRIEADNWRGSWMLVTDGAPEDIDAPGPMPANGYYKNVFPIAAGLGAFFPPAPAWLGDEASTGFNMPVDPQIPGIPAELAPIAFLNGLNAVEPLAQTMGSTQLTTLTSPSRGCAVGVLCTPESIPVKFDSGPTVSTATVCYDEKPVSRGVFTSGIWTATYPHPTAQLGIWGTADGIETYGPGDYLVRGIPGLAPAGTPVTGQLLGIAQFTKDADGNVVLESMEGDARQKGVTPNFGQDPQQWLDAVASGPYTICGP